MILLHMISSVLLWVLDISITVSAVLILANLVTGSTLAILVLLWAVAGILWKVTDGKRNP